MILIDGRLGKIAADYINCGSDQPLVIITHGRSGNRNTNPKKVAEYLESFRISSLRIDLYGYGDSNGKFEDITITTAKESVIGAYNYVVNNLVFNKLFFFGTSYGGSGILAAIDKLDPQKVSGLFFRSAVVNYLAKTKRELSEVEILKWQTDGSRPDSEGKLNYSFFQDMAQYTKIDYSRLGQFKTIFFHGDKDTKVLTSELVDIKSHIPQSFDLITYPNSDHGLDVPEDFADMLNRIKDFILKTTTLS